MEFFAFAWLNLVLSCACGPSRVRPLDWCRNYFLLLFQFERLCFKRHVLLSHTLAIKSVAHRISTAEEEPVAALLIGQSIHHCKYFFVFKIHFFDQLTLLNLNIFATIRRGGVSFSVWCAWDVIESFTKCTNKGCGQRIVFVQRKIQRCGKAF